MRSSIPSSGRNAREEQAALDGKYRGGRRAFGYEEDGVSARPEEAAAIRKAADNVLAGVSLRQIARDWNAAGLRTSFGGNEFSSREVRKILLRPRNAGIVLHEGKRVGEGDWEKIIDVDTFAGLEAVLHDPSRQVSSFERRYQGSGSDASAGNPRGDDHLPRRTTAPNRMAGAAPSLFGVQASGPRHRAPGRLHRRDSYRATFSAGRGNNPRWLRM